jgi:hypothetical protein
VADYVRSLSGLPVDAKAGTYVKIPRNYADPTKTTLKYSVKDGTQTIDIALKD